MIRTLVLDLDGPILDGRFRHYACYRGILRAHGHVPLGLQDYWRMKRGRAGRREQLAASDAEALYEEFSRAWLEQIERPELLALDRLQDGVTTKLREWRDRGIRLILATMRRYPERLDGQLVSLGIRAYFDHVVVCEHRSGGAGKARKVGDAVAGLDPEQCLWVGDTEIDVEAARAFGCPVWAVTRGLRTESYLASLSPDFLGPDLRSVNLERCITNIADTVRPGRSPAGALSGGAQ